MNKKQKFSEMKKSEKKNYLSMDFILRMIRTEQKVASSLGENLLYKKTQYYKSLPNQTKEKFDKFIKIYPKKGTTLKNIFFFLGIIAFVGIGVYIFANPSGITGNVIKTNTVKEGALWFIGAFIALVGVSIGILTGATAINKKKRNKNFEDHAKVIDKVNFKKKVRDNFRN